MNGEYFHSFPLERKKVFYIVIYSVCRLLGEADAFDLGHTFDPKTFGIWMGTKILVGKDKNGKELAVLLLDTEGIGKYMVFKS